MYFHLMETGLAINKLSHRLQRRSQVVHKSLGISETQGRILNYILAESAAHNVHPKDLEEEFGLRSSTVTGILLNLERSGMIVKKTDPDDKRQKILLFTSKADGIREALQAEINETEQRMLSGISEEERDFFLKIADRMLVNLDEAGSSPCKKEDKKKRKEDSNE